MRLLNDIVIISQICVSGASHAVDSSELAFITAAEFAVRQGYKAVWMAYIQYSLKIVTDPSPTEIPLKLIHFLPIAHEKQNTLLLM